VIPGKWTMIYDQAFDVELENGMRFLNNFRYNLNPEEYDADILYLAEKKGPTAFEGIK
jgi:Cathepsin C exclusion domain